MSNIIELGSGEMLDMLYDSENGEEQFLKLVENTFGGTITFDTVEKTYIWKKGGGGEIMEYKGNTVEEGVIQIFKIWRKWADDQEKFIDEVGYVIRNGGFSALHDKYDANMMLPFASDDYIAKNDPEGEYVNYCNATMDMFNVILVGEKKIDIREEKKENQEVYVVRFSQAAGAFINTFKVKGLKIAQEKVRNILRGNGVFSEEDLKDVENCMDIYNSNGSGDHIEIL